MSKILSISDVITNSSSEVFCIITADTEEIARQILDALGGEDATENSIGEGGIYLKENELHVSLGYDIGGNIINLIKVAINHIVEPFDAEIHYEYN